MTSDDDPYLDLDALRARGWTDRLIARFLGEPDWRAPVKHWANFTGKSLYYVRRVEAIEGTELFCGAFEASIRRRRVSAEALEVFLRERSK